MGLDINVRKPIRFLGTEEPDNIDDIDNWTYVDTLDFSPIKHITKFQTGYWEAEIYEEPWFNMSYGSFTRSFRECICQAMFGKDYNATIDAMYKGEIPYDAPFAEMLFFADNEGCFDYVVAEKLLKDFRDNADRILPIMDDFTQGGYASYTDVLEKCVEVKGVVDYH